MRNYISKLNDRNLQRKRESGFTAYVLISILIIFGNYILDIYHQIPFKLNTFDVLKTLANCFNTCFAIFMISLLFSLTSGYTSSIRIKRRSVTTDSFLGEAIEFTIFFFPFVLNMALLLYSYIKMHSVIYPQIFSSIFHILIIQYFIVKIFNKNKNKTIYEIFDGTGKGTTDKDFFSIAAYIYFFIVLFYSFWASYSQPMPFKKTEVFKFGYLIFSIPLILLKLINLRKDDGLSQALENLEFEIYVRNLQDPEIAQELQNNYMGFLLPNWTDTLKNELIKFCSMTDAKIADIRKFKTDLSAIDKNKYPHEWDARLKIITTGEVEISSSINTFFNEKADEINKILSKSNLNNTERNDLANFSQEINKVHNRYKENIF